MAGRTRRDRLVRPFLAILLCLAAAGCQDRVRGRIMRELPRPGGGATAILTEDYGKDVYYDVYLKRDDGSVLRVFEAFDMDKAPNIRWQNPHALVVQMTCAAIVGYKNHFSYPEGPESAFVFVGLEGNTRLCAHFKQITPGL